MSDYRGYQGRDPAERLSAALDRIATALERRDAQARVAAAYRDRLPTLSPGGSAELPAIAANLDALIARLRAVLDTGPPGYASPGSGLTGAASHETVEKGG